MRSPDTIRLTGVPPDEVSVPTMSGEKANRIRPSPSALAATRIPYTIVFLTTTPTSYRPNVRTAIAVDPGMPTRMPNPSTRMASAAKIHSASTLADHPHAIRARAEEATIAASIVMSHFSCWRSSGAARRYRRTRLANPATVAAAVSETPTTANAPIPGIASTHPGVSKGRPVDGSDTSPNVSTTAASPPSPTAARQRGESRRPSGNSSRNVGSAAGSTSPGTATASSPAGPAPVSGRPSYPA